MKGFCLPHFFMSSMIASLILAPQYRSVIVLHYNHYHTLASQTTQCLDSESINYHYHVKAMVGANLPWWLIRKLEQVKWTLPNLMVYIWGSGKPNHLHYHTMASLNTKCLHSKSRTYTWYIYMQRLVLVYNDPKEKMNNYNENPFTSSMCLLPRKIVAA